MGLVPEQYNKVNILLKQVTQFFFCFQGHIEVMFTVYCKYNSMMSKKINIHILIKNILLLESAFKKAHHLSL